MKEGTVKTSTLLIPKLKTLREFGESVTDADVDNFDELVEAGFVKCETEQEESDAPTEGTSEGTSELFAAMTETVVEKEIVLLEDEIKELNYSTKIEIDLKPETIEYLDL